MNDLKRLKKLCIKAKEIHYRWLVGHITEAGENIVWVNRAIIYKTTLRFISKAWWLIIKHQIIPTNNDNILGATNAYLVTALILGVKLNA